MTNDKNKIRNVHCEDDSQKDFIDPATTVAIGTFSWFAFKAALQGVIGWVAVKLFEPIWNKMRTKNESDNQEVSKEK